MGANDMLEDAQDTTYETYAPGVVPDPTGNSGAARTVRVPTMFCRYEYESSYDDNSFCKDITVDQVATLTDGGQKWSVVATFRPNEPNESSNDSNSDPTLRPALVSWDRETFREEAQHGIPVKNTESDLTPEGEVTTHTKQRGEHDHTEDPVEIRNTAGGLYESPVEVIKTRSVVVVTFNVSDLKVASEVVSKYQGTVNKTDYFIHGDGQENNKITVKAGTGLTREVVVSEQQTEGENTFYKVQFRIAIEPRTWVHKAVERGRGHLVLIDAVDQGFSDPEGNPLPVPDDQKKYETLYEADYITLSEDGQLVEAHANGELAPTVTTDWVVYAQEDYAGLVFTSPPTEADDPCP
tara:strand:+ start:45 stop:1100 length:1056 start_codon:yes stop_codon:yes gene_type:complete